MTNGEKALQLIITSK